MKQEEQNLVNAFKVDQELSKLIQKEASYLVPALVAGGAGTLAGGSAASGVEREGESRKDRRNRILRTALGTGAASAGAVGLGAAGLDRLNNAVPDDAGDPAGTLLKLLAGGTGATMGVGAGQAWARGVPGKEKAIGARKSNLDWGGKGLFGPTSSFVDDLGKDALRPGKAQLKGLVNAVRNRGANSRKAYEALSALTGVQNANDLTGPIRDKYLRETGVDIANAFRLGDKDVLGKALKNKKWGEFLSKSRGALRRGFYKMPRTIGGVAGGLGALAALPILGGIGKKVIGDVSGFE